MEKNGIDWGKTVVNTMFWTTQRLNLSAKYVQTIYKIGTHPSINHWSNPIHF